MVTQHDGTWTVPLADSHTHYTSVNLKRRFPTLNEYCVIVVDTARFMECFAREKPGFIIPTVDNWTDDKRDGIRRFLDPNDEGTPEMSGAYFEYQTRKKWFGLFGTTTVGVVSFENGRHRARYLQFAGARCIPVETHVSGADALLKHCGCTCCNPTKRSC